MEKVLPEVPVVVAGAADRLLVVVREVAARLVTPDLRVLWV